MKNQECDSNIRVPDSTCKKTKRIKHASVKYCTSRLPVSFWFIDGLSTVIACYRRYLIGCLNIQNTSELSRPRHLVLFLGKKPKEPWRGRSNLRWDMASTVPEPKTLAAKEKSARVNRLQQHQQPKPPSCIHIAIARSFHRSGDDFQRPKTGNAPSLDMWSAPLRQRNYPSEQPRTWIGWWNNNLSPVR